MTLSALQSSSSFRFDLIRRQKFRTWSWRRKGLLSSGIHSDVYDFIRSLRSLWIFWRQCYEYHRSKMDHDSKYLLRPNVNRSLSSTANRIETDACWPDIFLDWSIWLPILRIRTLVLWCKRAGVVPFARRCNHWSLCRTAVDCFGLYVRFMTFFAIFLLRMRVLLITKRRQFAYAEEKDKGTYIAWQLFLLNLGCAIGASVAFGINFHDTSLNGVPTSVYFIFIIIMASAVILAYVFFARHCPLIAENITNQIHLYMI